MPYEPYESPFMSNRVQRQFGEMDFGGNDLQNWQPQQLEEPSDSRNYYGDVREAYGQTPALDAYRQHLKQLPQPDDYRPNWMTRIAAGLSGLSAGMKDAGAGIQTAMGVNRMGYDNALKDYYNQAAPLKEAAGLERSGIDDYVNHIMKANELGIKYDDYRRQLAKDRGELDIKGREVGVSEDRLDWDQEYGRKRLNQFDRDINSLTNYRNVTGAAQTRNAATGAYNAQTGRMNAGTQATGVANQGRNIDSMITQRGEGTLQGWANIANENERLKMMGKAGGTDLEKFQQGELQNLKAKYPSFVTMDDNGDYVIDPESVPAPNTPEYQDFLAFQRELSSGVNYRSRLGQIQFGAGAEEGGNANPADNPWELMPQR